MIFKEEKLLFREIGFDNPIWLNEEIIWSFDPDPILGRWEVWKEAEAEWWLSLVVWVVKERQAVYIPDIVRKTEAEINIAGWYCKPEWDSLFRKAVWKWAVWEELVKSHNISIISSNWWGTGALHMWFDSLALQNKMAIEQWKPENRVDLIIPIPTWPNHLDIAYKAWYRTEDQAQEEATIAINQLLLGYDWKITDEFKSHLIKKTIDQTPRLHLIPYLDESWEKVNLKALEEKAVSIHKSWRKWVCKQDLVCHNHTWIDFTKKDIYNFINIWKNYWWWFCLDAAYIGLWDWFEKDKERIIPFLEGWVLAMTAISFSKNWAYNYRTWALLVPHSSPENRENYIRSVNKSWRPEYSNPSLTWQRIIQKIIDNHKKHSEWSQGLDRQRNIISLKKELFRDIILSILKTNKKAESIISLAEIKEWLLSWDISGIRTKLNSVEWENSELAKQILNVVYSIRTLYISKWIFTILPLSEKSVEELEWKKWDWSKRIVVWLSKDGFSRMNISALPMTKLIDSAKAFVSKYTWFEVDSEADLSLIQSKIDAFNADDVTHKITTKLHKHSDLLVLESTGSNILEYLINEKFDPETLINTLSETFSKEEVAIINKDRFQINAYALDNNNNIKKLFKIIKKHKKSFLLKKEK